LNGHFTPYDVQIGNFQAKIAQARLANRPAHFFLARMKDQRPFPQALCQGAEDVLFWCKARSIIAVRARFLQLREQPFMQVFKDLPHPKTVG
jgi:hypothetical protein